MTREQIREEILKIPSKNILLLLATSVGKTKCALDFVCNKKPLGRMLIVIPRLVLIDGWKKEIIKWGYKELLSNITFVTYKSLHKYEYDTFKCIIYDECHHLSDNCLESVCTINSEYNILLSATVKRNHLLELKHCFPGLYVYKVSLKEAIDETILPDPQIYLIPLELDNIYETFQIIKNPKSKSEIVIYYKDRWKYINNPLYKNTRIVMYCTAKQYYLENKGLIEWYKTKRYNPVFRNKFQQACLERLKWLSEQKEGLVLEILRHLPNKRVLTFCSSIEQTETLGEYCINSKNKNALEILDKFQNKKINHITACGMLNEGANLNDCQIGVFASLHSSEIIITQRNGRLLRHSNPIFIIPYFKDTRDEEIVKLMLKDYNPDKITVAENIYKLMYEINNR